MEHGTSSASRQRILIVDDETAQMTALCDTLRDQGYDTVGFCDGTAALDALEHGRFDLLLSDLMMPGMDGIALIESARKLDPELAAIIMTGEGTIATAVEAMKVGALDYILKPFKLSFILPAIARALTIRRLRIRNAELEQSLHDRAEKLEAANRDLESFSYSVSHDLRAPLRAVVGYARILEEDHAGRLDDETQRLIRHIRASGERMNALIHDLLEFSRLGRQSMARTVIDMEALAQAILTEVCIGLPAPVDAKVEHLPSSNGDPSLLRQVWTNLLSNAVKFTRHQPQPQIVVSGFRDRKENVYCVRDNGAGFNMEYAARLFGVFQRLHSATEFEGTGVGLAIVHRIVTRHGGRVWAEGKAGAGASFYFALPA